MVRIVFWFGVAAILAIPLAFAQPYPSKPIRMVVPFSAGGPIDILARLIAPRLSEAWGQQVVVENRVGASGMIGADAVAKAPADGHTVLVNSSIHVIVPSLHAKVPYDAIRDFTPVTLITQSPLLLLVTPTLPVKNVKELVALARARPGELSFGSAGSGSSTHLSGELLKSVTGIKMIHVPYKGSGQALIDVMAGQVPMMFNSMTASMGFVKSGRLRVLAITSAQRYPQLPGVPTFAESGYKELTIGSWYAIWLPPKTPQPIVSKLNAEIGRILKLPDVRSRIVELGGEPVGNSPSEFDAYQKSELVRWATVVKESGAKVE